MKYLSDLYESHVDVLEFKESLIDSYYTYKIDYKARERLNSVLGTEFVAVYREETQVGDLNKKQTDFDLDCETIYCVRKDGKIVRFTNSEWGGLELMGKGEL